MSLPRAARRAWLLHDSGAMGTEFVAVIVHGSGRTMATCERGGARFRTAVGNLAPVRGADGFDAWAEDYARA